MQSILFNSYNSGAATTIGGTVVGGGMNMTSKHTEYPITDTLCVYLSMRRAVDVDKLKPNP